MVFNCLRARDKILKDPAFGFFNFKAYFEFLKQQKKKNFDLDFRSRAQHHFIKQTPGK